MNSQQYVWISIVVVGIVGGVEIGYAIAGAHHPYGMHHRFDGYQGFDGYGGYDGSYHHSGYMMQDPQFRQQLYSSMFDSTQYRQEMSQYLAEHPEALRSWCETMMNNPFVVQTMQGMMGHGMMGGMMHGMNMSGMGMTYH